MTIPDSAGSSSARPDPVRPDPVGTDPVGLDPALAARLRRDHAGLIPAVVQEFGTNTVLMVAWMDDVALHRTLTTGRATYWSRSRQEYWVKGETSGHVQHVRAVALDCDADTLLVTVEQVGPACHTGSHSCFAEHLPVAFPASGALRVTTPGHPVQGGSDTHPREVGA